MCAGVLLTTTGACSSTSTGSPAEARTSCEIETKAMKASLSVQARGPETQVFAAVFKEGNVALGCGDTFSATVSGLRVVLERAPDSDGGTSGPVHYVTKVPSPTAATMVTVALERSAPKTSAPASKAYLPPAFAVRDLSANVRVSSGENVHFRIEPPLKIDNLEVKPDSVQLRLELEGTCLDGVQTFLWAKPTFVPPKVDADGTVTLVNTNKILKRKGDQAGCDVTMRVATMTTGEVDPAFAGSLEGGAPVEGSRHEQTSFRLDW